MPYLSIPDGLQNEVHLVLGDLPLGPLTFLAGDPSRSCHEKEEAEEQEERRRRSPHDRTALGDGGDEGKRSGDRELTSSQYQKVKALL